MLREQDSWRETRLADMLWYINEHDVSFMLLSLTDAQRGRLTTHNLRLNTFLHLSEFLHRNSWNELLELELHGVVARCNDTVAHIHIVWRLSFSIWLKNTCMMYIFSV